VLGNDAAIRHAFFTRLGGVSNGLYRSLNCGFGSGDKAEDVTRNREIAMAQLGLTADRLVTCYQIHSARVVVVDTPWPREAAPQADGMVTRVAGIALGVLTADCGPILFRARLVRSRTGVSREISRGGLLQPFLFRPGLSSRSFYVRSIELHRISARPRRDIGGAACFARHCCRGRALLQLSAQLPSW